MPWLVYPSQSDFSADILQYPHWLSSTISGICWWYFNSKWPEINPVSNLISALSSWISFWYLFFVRNTNFLACLRPMWFSHRWENLSSTQFNFTLGYHEMVLSQLSYVGLLSLLNSLHIHYGYGLHDQISKRLSINYIFRVHLEM